MAAHLNWEKAGCLRSSHQEFYLSSFESYGLNIEVVAKFYHQFVKISIQYIDHNLCIKIDRKPNSGSFEPGESGLSKELSSGILSLFVQKLRTKHWRGR